MMEIHTHMDPGLRRHSLPGKDDVTDFKSHKDKVNKLSYRQKVESINIRINNLTAGNW